MVKPLESLASPESPVLLPQHRLPLTDPHYQRVRSYVEDTPIAEYQWAPSAAYEAFRDMKYGIRIHWGLYSVAGFENRIVAIPGFELPGTRALQPDVQDVESNRVRCG